MAASGATAPPRVRLSRLVLTDFRNYDALRLDLPDRHIVLTGDNGAGKTNLLEAVSLLSPGRGLRRAAYGTMAREDGPGGFAVHAALDGPFGDAEIGTGLSVGTDGQPESVRRVRINGAPMRSADTLLEWLRVIWLTPAMDGLFSGPAGDRRRFLDRLVLAIDAGHGRRTLDYEKAMRARNRLLAQDRSDAQWLDAIEAQMAETGIAIAAARRELVRLLEAMIARTPADSAFPKASFALDEAEPVFTASDAAVDQEAALRAALERGRAGDRAAGRTLAGPHRTDLEVRHTAKSMPAALCSTGEQKALLIGIVLAHARLTAEMAGMTPVLLLDEIAAHLDAVRRGALFAMLDDLNCQAFMTGTDTALFEALGEHAARFDVVDGRISAADGA